MRGRRLTPGRPRDRRGDSAPAAGRRPGTRPLQPARPPRPAEPLSEAGRRLAAIDELELTVERLVAGGDGLARYEGTPIFVPFSAPGDRLRVRLVERHPDYGRGEIVELLAPGAGRREPPCPVFARCGGCDLQHLEDAYQLRLKVEATLETLRRLGRVEIPGEKLAVVAAEAWGWRARAQIHTAPVAGGVAVGFHARGSRELVPTERCPILVPELERELATLARRLPPEEAPRRLDAAIGDGGRVGFAPVVTGLPHGELSVRVGEFSYRFDARCFFQGHRGLLPHLVVAAVGDWQGERAFDLYGGVGLFALPLARRYREVTLVEGDRIAARYARLNFADHRSARGRVVTQAVESWLPRGLPDEVDRVLVDPPRAGLPAATATLLGRRRPRRLTYVSCHAAALARDLARLGDGFALERLTLLDLFPQTGHLEAVVQLAAL